MTPTWSGRTGESKIRFGIFSSCQLIFFSFMVGVAGRDILAGEEVCDNYGKHYAQSGKKSRQEFLTERYVLTYIKRTVDSFHIDF